MVRPHPIGAEAEQSFRRCQARRRAVVTLSSLTEAYPRQLAHAIGIDAGRLRAVMEGRLPKYSVARSPIALGLAAILVTERGRKYVITEKGRRKARMMTARVVRRTGEQVRAHVPPAPMEGVGALSTSFTWSVHPHLPPVRPAPPVPRLPPVPRASPGSAES